MSKEAKPTHYLVAILILLAISLFSFTSVYSAPTETNQTSFWKTIYCNTIGDWFNSPRCPLREDIDTMEYNTVTLVDDEPNTQINNTDTYKTESNLPSINKITINRDSPTTLSPTNIQTPIFDLSILNNYVTRDYLSLHNSSTNSSDYVTRDFLSRQVGAIGDSFGRSLSDLSTRLTALIPSAASITNWDSFFTTPSTRILAGTNLSWDGNTLNAVGSAGGVSLSLSNNIFGQSSLTPTTTQNLAISGIGTSTFAGGLESWRQIASPYFQATSTTATSTFAGGLSVTGNVGVGTILPTSKLSINGENKFLLPHKVYLMGDSLTGTSGHYGTQLANNLGGQWSIIWKGISGNTTTQMLARFTADVITPGDAEYVVIWGGVNDIVGVVAGSVTVATIKSNLQAMYDLAHDAGLKVVAVNVTPFSGDAGWASSGAVARAAQDEINYWIAKTAKNIDYRVDAYSVLVDPNVPYTLLATYDDGGHLHLTSAGYIVVANAIHSATTWTPVTVPTMNINGTPVFSGALQVTGTISGANLSGVNTGDQNLANLVPYTGATSNLNLGIFSASTSQLTTTGNAYFATSGTGSIRVDNNFVADSGGSIKWGVNVDTNDRVGFLSWDTGKVIIGSPTTMDLSFVTSYSSEKMRILQSNGNVGIGTTSPLAKLSVVGSVYLAGNLTATGTVTFDNLTASTGAGSICLSSTKELVYNAGSDACLPSLRSTKHDINNLSTSSLSTLNLLTPVSFIYNQGDNRTRYGFIAEDVSQIDTHLATYNDKGEISGIDDRALIALAIGSIKELDIKIRNIITSVGEWVFSKITATLGVFERVESDSVKSNRIETKTASVSDGIQMTDKVTGQVYCISLSGGNLDKSIGPCSTATTTTVISPTPTPDSTPTPSVTPISNLPTPTPIPTPIEIIDINSTTTVNVITTTPTSTPTATSTTVVESVDNVPTPTPSPDLPTPTPKATPVPETIPTVEPVETVSREPVNNPVAEPSSEPVSESVSP